MQARNMYNPAATGQHHNTWPNLVLDGVIVLLLVRSQYLVDLPTNQARLHCDLVTIPLHRARTSLQQVC